LLREEPMRTTPRPNGKYVTLRQAEKEYALPYHRLYRWVERGQLPRLSRNISGCSIYIKRSDLDAFLESNTDEVCRS